MAASITINPSIVVNNNTYQTNLSFTSYTDYTDITHYMISENSDFSGASWQTHSYSTNIPWLLDSATAVVEMDLSGTLIYVLRTSDSQKYKSTDGGVTWEITTQRFPYAMSSTGVKQLSFVNNGYLYVSTDSGSTWTQKDSVRLWQAVAMSVNGTVQAAVEYGGKIYISTDSGNTWTAKDSNRNWAKIAMSSDGTKQTAVVYGGQVYVSTDYGNTWTAKDSNRNWIRIAMSSDGTKQTALVNNGKIYVSTDSGNTWTEKDSLRAWSDIQMSADGTKQEAITLNKRYVSTDSGSTWTEATTINSSSGPTFKMSSDGTKRVYAYSYLFSTTDSGSNFTNISNDYLKNNVNYTLQNTTYGSKTIYYKTKTASTNPKETCNTTFTYNDYKTLSAGTMSIENGASSTYAKTNSISFTAPTRTNQVIISENSNFSGASWVSYSSPKTYTFNTRTIETKTVYAKFKDSNEIEHPTTINNTIYFDDIFGGSNGSVFLYYKDEDNITHNITHTYTYSRSIKALIERPPGTSTHIMMSFNTDFSGASWVPMSNYLWGTEGGFFENQTIVDITIPSTTEQTYTFYVKFKNSNYDLETEPVSNWTILDYYRTETTSSIVNNGSLDSMTKTIPFSFTVPENTTHYMISEDINFSGINWTTYNSSVFYTLTSLNEGSKTLYYKFKNNDNIQSPVGSYTLELEYFPEEIAPPNFFSEEITTSLQQTINIEYPVNAIEMIIGYNDEFIGVNWEPVSSTKNINLYSNGTNEVFLKFRNEDDYESDIYSFEIFFLENDSLSVASDPIAIEEITLTEYKQKVNCEKVALMQIHPQKIHKGWTEESMIYSKSFDTNPPEGGKTIISITYDSTTLVLKNSISALIEDSYYYDSLNKLIYIKLKNNVNPSTKDIHLTYESTLLNFDSLDGTWNIQVYPYYRHSNWTFLVNKTVMEVRKGSTVLTRYYDFDSFIAAGLPSGGGVYYIYNFFDFGTPYSILNVRLHPSNTNPTSFNIPVVYRETIELETWTAYTDVKMYHKHAMTYPIEKILLNGTNLTKGTSIGTLAQNQFYYDFDTQTTYMVLATTDNPETNFCSLQMLVSLSTKAVSLPYDLDSGREIFFEDLILEVSGFRFELDSEQRGIALEGSGDVKIMFSEDFRRNYDKYVWENAPAEIYLWSQQLDITDKIVLFKGLVTSRQIEDRTMNFTISDNLFKLREPLEIPMFCFKKDNTTTIIKQEDWIDMDEEDKADIYDQFPMRRIYGKVDGLLIPCSNPMRYYDIEADEMIDNASFLSGTIYAEVKPSDVQEGDTMENGDWYDEDTADIENAKRALYRKRITGSGTDFHDKLVAGDNIRLKMSDNSYLNYTVDTLSRRPINFDGDLEITFQENTPIEPNTLAIYDFDEELNFEYCQVGDEVVVGSFRDATFNGVYTIKSISEDYKQLTCYPPAGVTLPLETIEITMNVDEFFVCKHSESQELYLTSEIDESVGQSYSILNPLYISNYGNKDYNTKFIVSHHKIAQDYGTNSDIWQPQLINYSKNSISLSLGFNLFYNDYYGKFEIGDKVYFENYPNLFFEVEKIQRDRNAEGDALFPFSASDNTVTLTGGPIPSFPLGKIMKAPIYNIALEPSKRPGIAGKKVGNLSFDKVTVISNNSTDGFVIEIPKSVWNNAQIIIEDLGKGYVNNSTRCIQLLTKGKLANVQPNDFISFDKTTWYEIEEKFGDRGLILKTCYTTSNAIESIYLKKSYGPTNESKITCSTYGKTTIRDDFNSDDMGWCINPSQCILDILEEIDEINYINPKDYLGLIPPYVYGICPSSSFVSTHYASDYKTIMSLPIPTTIDGDIPTKREAIELINQSCVGSLYYDKNFNLNFNTFNTTRFYSTIGTLEDNKFNWNGGLDYSWLTAIPIVLSEYDIVKFDIETDSSNILRKVNTKYKFQDYAMYKAEKPFDKRTNSFEKYTATNSEVDNYKLTKNEKDIDLWLHNLTDATEVANRYALISKRAKSLIYIKTKQNLVDIKINDLIWLKAETLYSRLGSSDGKEKIGMVKSIEKKDGTTEIVLDDFGNAFNFTGPIKDHDIDVPTNYTTATDAQKAVTVFLTDDIGMIIDDEDIGTNVLQ